MPDCQTDGKEIARARGKMGMEGPGGVETGREREMKAR